jgi:hypothetical protein
MWDIKHWENKIKEKRKKTQFRDFVKEITSWTVLNLYKNKWKICKYPDTGRIKNIDTKEAINAQNYFNRKIRNLKSFCHNNTCPVSREALIAGDSFCRSTL